MADPARRSTARRLHPILLGLIGSIFAFLVLYAVVLLVTFAVAPRVTS